VALKRPSILNLLFHHGRRTDDVWDHRFYPEVRRYYFIPPSTEQLRRAPFTLPRSGQTRIARFAEIHRVGVYRVRNRLLQAGLLLVIGIGTYVHYSCDRVRSSENSTAGDSTGPTGMFRSTVRS
jgi:hypothetical protein